MRAYTKEERIAIYEELLSYYLAGTYKLVMGFCGVLVRYKWIDRGGEIAEFFPELIEYFVREKGYWPADKEYWWGQSDSNSRIKCLKWAIEKLTPFQKVCSGGVVPPRAPSIHDELVIDFEALKRKFGWQPDKDYLQKAIQEAIQENKQTTAGEIGVNEIKKRVEADRKSQQKQKTMATVLNGNDEIKRILEAFGITDDWVVKVVITFEVGSPVLVEVTRHASYDPNEVETEMKKYYLTKKPD